MKGYGHSTAVLAYAVAVLLLLPTIIASHFEPRIPDRLQITTTHEVECDRKTQEGDFIQVHYTGTLKKGGKKFDSSYDRNEPIAFQLGAGQVIAGWDQGLKDMCIGEERKLVVPPHLAYGQHTVGSIPGGSTLVFETKLVGIKGVDSPPDETTNENQNDDEDQDHYPQQEEDDADYGDPTPTVSYGSDAASQPEEDEAASSIQPKPENPEDDRECRLLGPFALFVQAGLGLLALLSLVWKRWRERPRRPLKIWVFDVSKQVVGSVLLHILNLLMSMISSSDLRLTTKVKEIGSQMVGDDGHRINPCSFYLINIAIDTTIGIPVLIVFLRLLHYAFRMTPLARPVESIKSGHYGQPPRATWWLKQCFIYFIGLVLMKLCVFFIVEILPWIAWVGDWALRWTEGNEALQITFVMFVFPLIMNALQYYIIDSFIKEPGVADYTQPDTSSEPGAGGTYHTVGGYDSDRDSLDSDSGSKSIGATSSGIRVKEQRPDAESEQHSRAVSGPGSGGNDGPL